MRNLTKTPARVAITKDEFPRALGFFLKSALVLRKASRD